MKWFLFSQVSEISPALELSATASLLCMIYLLVYTFSRAALGKSHHFHCPLPLPGPLAGLISSLPGDLCCPLNGQVLPGNVPEVCRCLKALNLSCLPTPDKQQVSPFSFKPCLHCLELSQLLLAEKCMSLLTQKQNLSYGCRGVACTSRAGKLLGFTD